MQFTDDTEFLSKLLQVNSQFNNQIEQESDVSSSVSELNCRDVVVDWDKNWTREQESYKFGNTEKPDDMTTQQMINVQILNQLQNISQRLD